MVYLIPDDTVVRCISVIEEALARGFTLIGWMKEDRLPSDGRR